MCVSLDRLGNATILYLVTVQISLTAWGMLLVEIAEMDLKNVLMERFRASLLKTLPQLPPLHRQLFRRYQSGMIVPLDQLALANSPTPAFAFLQYRLTLQQQRAQQAQKL
jgi:hypothetical protein